MTLTAKLQSSANKKERFKCILDHVVHTRDGWLVVEDLKTGRVEEDDPLERHLYVWAAMKAFPDATSVRFEYFYCRSGNRLTFLYEPVDKSTMKVTCPQFGTEEILKGTSKLHPLFKPIREAFDELLHMDPKPNPGEHCTDWYGTPCQFAGRECPVGMSLPAIVRNEMVVPGTIEEIQTLPEAQRPGAAFLLIRDGLPEEEFTPELLSLAQSAVAQLRAGASSVEKKIREWSRTGGPIHVGDSTYSWKPARTVDKVAALEILLANGKGAREIAPLISMSRISIERMSKTDPLREPILDACVDEAGRQEFGVLRSQE